MKKQIPNTQKLFPNNGSVVFDSLFLPIRERGKSKWKIRPASVRNLHLSILRSFKELKDKSSR